MVLIAVGAVTFRRKYRDSANLHSNITKLFSFVFAILLLAGSAAAANWYVRPVAQGAATGKDWNNAWSLSSINWSSVNPGDTIWLAGGRYSTGLTVSASGAPGSVINVLSALSTDTVPVSAPGWDPSFDCRTNQVVLPGPDGIFIPSSSHININGRFQYGILITVPQSGGPGLEAVTEGSKGTDLNFRYIDVLGPYCNETTKQSPPDNEPRGWKVSPANGASTDASFILFNHCRVRGMGIGFHCLADHVTVEYCTFADMFPAFSGDHEDVMYCYPSPNMIWRYNFIINSEENGLFFEFGGADHFQLYGNVFYNTTNSQMTFKNGGQTYGPVFIYNNVFQAPSTAAYGWITTNSSPIAAGSLVYNNIFFNVQNDIEQSTSDYNAYNYSSLGGYSWNSSETHSFTFSGNPFVNIPPASPQPGMTTQFGDFRLTAASALTFQNGLVLALDGFINYDLNGNQRGNGGHWYIGAYQNSGATSNSTPPAPTGLHIVAPR
jgi:hypothetical protein